MAGCFFLLESWASGTVLAPASPLGFHWFAPPGLCVSSHSNLKRWSKNPLPHFVGVVGLAEGVAARDQRHRFFVVHGHAAERDTDIFSRTLGVRLALGAFRVH